MSRRGDVPRGDRPALRGGIEARRDPAPRTEPGTDPTSKQALEAWAAARLDELVAEGHAALRARSHDLATFDLGGLAAEVEVEPNLYATECVDVTAIVWRPRRPRPFPLSLLPRLRRSLVSDTVTVAPDGALVEVGVDGERVPVDADG